MYTLKIKNLLALLFFLLFTQFLVLSSIASDTGYSNNKTACNSFNSYSVLWPKDKTNLDYDKSVIYKTLPNGFKYILMKNSNPKDRVSMHLNVNTGSLNENDNQQGIAHFLEHMLFCGSTHFKPGELIKYFQKLGMNFGGDTNAHTGFNETVYDLFLPDGMQENLDKGLLVMHDYAQGALLLQSEADRERNVILEEKRLRDSASYRTFVAVLKFELQGSRLTRRLPIGLEKIIKTIGTDDLRLFYDTWYRPENMSLVLVGDFDTNLASKIIKERFSDLSPRKQAVCIKKKSGKINHKGIKPFYHYENEAGDTKVSICVVTDYKKGVETKNQRKTELYQDMACSIINNRFSSLIGKGNAPVTSASIFSGIFFKDIAYGAISARCLPEKTQETLTLLENTLRSALKYGFTESELKRVKKDYMASITNAAKTASTRESSALARSLINHYNNNKIFMSPDQEKLLYEPMINSVSLETINSEFVKIWLPSHRLITVTGNIDLNKQNTTPEKQILKMYTKSKTIKIAPYTDNKFIKFPYLTPDKKEGVVIKRTEHKGIGIVSLDFENGIKLNIKKTDFEKNKILINIAFGHGKIEEPKDKPGLAIFSEAVVNGSGLGKYIKDDILKALSGKNVSVSFNIKENRFEYNGVTASDDIETLFQLLYTHVIDQGINIQAYELAKIKIKKMITTLSKKTEGAMTLHGNSFLAGGDLRFGIPPIDKFNNITIDDIKKYIKKALSENQLEISVIGDCNIPDIIHLCSIYFGSIEKKKRGFVKHQELSPLFPTGKKLNIKVPTKINKSIVYIAFATDEYWNIKKTRRLMILSQILSERIRLEIREKLGAAYSTYVYNKPSKGYKEYGVLKIVVSTTPEKTDMVINKLNSIISSVVLSGITEDELKLATGPVLTSIKDMLESNRYWLNNVMTGSAFHPEKLDWPKDIKEDYSLITKDGIDFLSKKYLDILKSALILVESQL